MREICVARLRERLRYEHRTGELFWREAARDHFATDQSWKIWNGRFSGKRAGSLNSIGYITIRVYGERFAAHRVAWAMHTGSWPENHIDHINGVRHDNRFGNLRVVTKQENAKNMRLRTDNTSGAVGVYWDDTRQRWRARVYCDGKAVFLGSFKDFSDAVSARDAANVKFGYHPNHGRIENAQRQPALPAGTA